MVTTNKNIMTNHWRRFNQLHEMYDGGGYTSGGIQTSGPYFQDWKPWFAWRPVRLANGSRCWLRKIYRRAYERTYVDHDDWIRYQYGTLLDVLANPDRNVQWARTTITITPFKGQQDG